MIHPTAVIGADPEHRDFNPGLQGKHYPKIAESARINAFVTVDAGFKASTWIGERVFCMTKTHVGHDAIIGDDCELAPGTVIGGHAKLGKGVRCGLNVSVKPFVKIGDGARLGMGAVVIRDVPAGEVWAGNPARELGSDRFMSPDEVEAWEAVYAHQPSDAWK